MDKFAIGEKVWVKPIKECKETNLLYIPNHMDWCFEKQFKVAGFDCNGNYNLKRSNGMPVQWYFDEEWLESEEDHEARTRKEEKVMKFKDLKVGTLFRCNTSTMFVKTKFCIMTNGRLQYISPIVGPDAGVTNYVTFIDEDEVTPINIDEPRNDDLWVIAQDALEHFGATTQICQTMEECAELIQALNKSLRHQSDPEKVRHNILEELADVTIMIEQMKLHFDEEEEFDDILEAKKDKLRSYLSEQEAD